MNLKGAMKPLVLLIDDDQDRRAMLEQALLAAGYAVTVRAVAGKDLLDAVNTVQPDVIVIDVDSPDRDTLEHMCSVARDAQHPVVMFTHDEDADRMRTAIRAGVSAYVVGGLSSERVKHIVDVAVLRFKEHQALRQELAQTKLSLAERKVIERAKGVLMRQRSCGEEQAFQALRKMAMDRNRRLAEVAQSVIDAAELLG
ncbi:MAG: ANTAR domain-containing response regulator [Gammaproteobacteria bacterium]